MSAMASVITTLMIVYSTVYSGADQRNHQTSVSPAFVRGIHRSPVNSPHRGPVTRGKCIHWWRHHDSPDLVDHIASRLHSRSLHRLGCPLWNEMNSFPVRFHEPRDQWMQGNHDTLDQTCGVRCCIQRLAELTQNTPSILHGKNYLISIKRAMTTWRRLKRYRAL